MRKQIPLLALIITFCFSCGSKSEKTKTTTVEIKKIEKESHLLFGYNLDNYKVIKRKIRTGETFGNILDQHHVWTPRIYQIANTIKPKFNVRKLRTSKNYTILASKDSLQTAKVFIYQKDLVNYSIVDFRDSIYTKTIKKKVTTVLKKTSGVITSSLSQSLDAKHVNPVLANDMSEIYAWTINFFKLQKNDKFKVIYEQKYINDTIPVGIGKIKAAYFEHVGKPFYAFSYVPDSITGISEYFDDNAKNLRRTFLKAPLKFSRISSRYNLKRRIAFYGKVKPHLGTDFAAPIGSPIMATANGKVIASRYKGGNGNYVKIKHNATYSTQYLHMKKRKVKKGDIVKQGDIIGWVGVTGNTSGPHVCYRFWKNGKQVDPLKQKLPAAKPMKKEIQQKYLTYIAPIKMELDALPY